MAKKPLSEEQRQRKREYGLQWDRDHREERNKRKRERYWADPEKGRAKYWAAKAKKS
jgi:hypothetical protein